MQGTDGLVTVRREPGEPKDAGGAGRVPDYAVRRGGTRRASALRGAGLLAAGGPGAVMNPSAADPAPQGGAAPARAGVRMYYSTRSVSMTSVRRARESGATAASVAAAERIAGTTT